MFLQGVLPLSLFKSVYGRKTLNVPLVTMHSEKERNSHHKTMHGALKCAVCKEVLKLE